MALAALLAAEDVAELRVAWAMPITLPSDGGIANASSSVKA